jgi:hypothetical protein
MLEPGKLFNSLGFMPSCYEQRYPLLASFGSVGS